MWHWPDGTMVGSPIDCDGYLLPKISQKEITRRYKNKYGRLPGSLSGSTGVYHWFCDVEEQHRLYHAMRVQCPCRVERFEWRS